jgi:hypothetical protein
MMCIVLLKNIKVLKEALDWKYKVENANKNKVHSLVDFWILRLSIQWLL